MWGNGNLNHVYNKCQFLVSAFNSNRVFGQEFKDNVPSILSVLVFAIPDIRIKVIKSRGQWRSLLIADTKFK